MKNLRQSSSRGRAGIGLSGSLAAFVMVLGACSTPEETGPNPGGAGAGGSARTGGTGGSRATGGSGPASGGGSSGSTGGMTGNTGGSTGGAPAGGGGGGGAPAGGSGGGAADTAAPGGAGGQADSGAPSTGGAGGGAGGAGGSNFSFFVVSLKALQTLSGKTEGFGGDLRFGKPDGLSGADEICKRAAEMGMPGAGAKNWKALLSVAMGPGGQPVHARDRIGKGPWYDRKGRLMAMNLTDLFGGDRPKGDPQLVNDFTNERGEPNNFVGANGLQTTKVDNHDTLTGSSAQGMLSGSTCADWTSTTGAGPLIGHSWPRSANSGRHWISDHRVPGCTPGLDRTLGGSGGGSCVGCSGGYGGFYCFVAQ